VLINLIGNALKFTERGSVAVRVSADERTRRPTRIDVIDTGIGIPPERRENIFEAFQQVESAASRKYGGTGLGLTISRSLCRLLGFRLLVDSEVGRGSTFSIVLP
jgi:signal transduction histidine kinase